MKNLFLMFLCMFLVLGCGRSSEKETSASKDQLPAATQTGANTAGCNVNGQVVIAKNGMQSIGGQPQYGILSSVGPNFNNPPVGNDIWDLLITNFENKNSLSVSLANLSVGIGNYPLNQNNHMSYTDSRGTYTSYVGSGQITITRFDYSLGIYSGTFYGKLKNNLDSSDIIDVTDGRFDINYTTLNK